MRSNETNFNFRHDPWSFWFQHAMACFRIKGSPNPPQGSKCHTRRSLGNSGLQMVEIVDSYTCWHEQRKAVLILFFSRNLIVSVGSQTVSKTEFFLAGMLGSVRPLLSDTNRNSIFLLLLFLLLL